MAKKKKDEQPEDQLPTQFDQGEAPDTDERLDGLPEPGQVVMVTPHVTGFDQAVSQTRSYHEGFEAALRKYAWTRDGVDFVGNQGTTLAEAMDHNNEVCRAKLRGLGL